MTITLDLMTKLIRQAGNNPFASAKTRARNLLSQLDQLGYEVTRRNIFKGMMDEESAPVVEPEPEHEVTPLTRKKQARIYYERQNWSALYNLKKTSKVYWDRFGFTANEIRVINSNNPN